MPPNPSVPDIPADWPQREADGTPYRLGIIADDTAWIPTVVFPLVTDTAHATVTTLSGRPVFTA